MTVWSSTFVSLGTIVSGSANTWVVSVGGTYASQSMSAATVGASVPTASDNVFFDANSNSSTTAFTVTMATTPRLCNDFTASGLDGTMTLAGSAIGLTVSGSLTFQATNFTRTYTGTTTFNATTTGKTVTTNGVAFGAAVDFSGAGGAWTLGSAISVGTSSITVTNGTFSTSVTNYNITAGSFSIPSNTNTRSISFNGSTVTLSSSATAFDGTGGSGTTFNAGTSTISMSGSSPLFIGGARTYSTVSFTSTSSSGGVAKVVQDANTFTNFNVSTPTTNVCNPIGFTANQTISGTLTATGSVGNRRLYICSSNSSGDTTYGTSITLTCAAIAAMSDVDFSDITIAGAAGTLSGTRLGNAGGNSNITFVAGKTVYWNLAAGGAWNDNGWATSSGGAVATTNYPLPQDTGIVENTGLTAGNTISVSSPIQNISGVDMSTRTNAMTFATSTSITTYYGNFSFGTGVTNTGAGRLIFSNRSTKTINTNGVTFTQNIDIDAPNGGIQLLTNNLTIDTTQTLTLYQGTLNLNGLVLSTGRFYTDVGTKNITFNGGTLTCTAATSLAFNNAVPTGFTTTAGTGTGTISMTAATGKTFVGGGSTYNCTLNQGGAGTLTITGSNTFTNITNTVQPNQITFTAGTTNTFTSFSLAGTAGNLITLRSSSAGTQYTLSDSSGIVSVSFLDIRDSNATGGAIWQAYTANGNVSSGNNSGWIFSPSNFFMMFI
jgi:hypothetical protein